MFALLFNLPHLLPVFAANFGLGRSQVTHLLCKQNYYKEDIIENCILYFGSPFENNPYFQLHYNIFLFLIQIVKHIREAIKSHNRLNLGNHSNRGGEGVSESGFPTSYFC